MHSQAAIEKSLLKNRPLLNAYCDFIISLVEEHFISKREPDERCIVFCAFRVFIEHLHKELMKRFPDLKVMRYKSGEGEEAYEKNLLNADISITTKKSAGTAVDIPGLLTVIDAHLQSSSPAVIQALGRLRKLETKTPKYVPLVCTDWRKHTEYAAKLRITLNGRVKKIVTVDYGQVQPNKNHQR
jgi:superfamily II DNA/RNA helicase